MNIGSNNQKLYHTLSTMHGVLLIVSEIGYQFLYSAVVLIFFFKMDFIPLMQPPTVQVLIREKKIFPVVTNSYFFMKILKVTECLLVMFHGSKY